MIHNNFRSLCTFRYNSEDENRQHQCVTASKKEKIQPLTRSFRFEFIKSLIIFSCHLLVARCLFDSIRRIEEKPRGRNGVTLSYCLLILLVTYVLYSIHTHTTFLPSPSLFHIPFQKEKPASRSFVQTITMLELLFYFIFFFVK